jgi:hypothetical protein
MAERTTQRRHRQREAENKEQQPVENLCHEKESIAYDAEQSSCCSSIPGASRANLPMHGGLFHCPESGCRHAALSAGNAVRLSPLSLKSGYRPGE